MNAEVPAEPLLRVVKGDPTPEQLAAVVAVVAARRAAPGADDTPTTARRTGWSARERTLRGVHRRTRVSSD